MDATEYRTVAYLRAGGIHDDPHLDGFVCAKWPAGFTNEGFALACAVEEISYDEWLAKYGFDDALRLMNSMNGMALRARQNLMEGPFIFTTDVPLDEGTTLALVLLKIEERKNERRRTKGA